MLNLALFVVAYISLGILALSKSSSSFNLYQLVYFFNPNGRWWGASLPGVSYSMLSVLLMMFCVVITYDRTKTNKIFASPNTKWMILVMIIYCLVWFISLNPDRHWDASVNFFKLVIIMILAYKLIDSHKRLKQAIIYNILGAAYLGLVAFQTGRNSGDRLEGIGMVDAPDANFFAATIVPPIIFTLYFLLIKHSRYLQFLIVLCGGLMANAIILINSRGSMLGILVGASFFVYSVFRVGLLGAQVKRAMAAMVVMGFVGLLAIADQSFWDRFSSIKQNTEVNYEEESAATRTYFWSAAIEMSYDHPLGKGFYGFNNLSHEYLPPDLNTGTSRSRSVHSTWFETLSNIGYPGLFCFLMMLYTSNRVLRVIKRKALETQDKDLFIMMLALQSGLLGFLVTISFIDRLRSEILYWCVIYCSCAYNIYVIKREAKANA